MISGLNNFINTRFLHSTSSGIKNIPSLDGIRGIAILMVVTCHLFAHSVNTGEGFLLRLKFADSSFDLGNFLLSLSNGVRLFFILSAFLLFLPYAISQKIDTKRFYWRRIKRIVPTYLLAIMLFALILWLTNSSFSTLNLLLNAFFVQPFFPFKGDIGPDFVPGTWSLVAEVHFYLLLPFIAWFFQNLKKGVPATFFLITLSFIYRAYIASHVTDPKAAFMLSHNLIAHIDQFGLGMLASLIYVRYGDKLKKSFWVSILLLFLGLASYWWIFNGGLSFIKDYETLLGLSFFMVVLGIALNSSLIKRWLEWSPLRLIGLVSYSMFLLNVIVIKYIFLPVMDALSINILFYRLVFNMTVGLALLFIISAVSYVYIEKPFLKTQKLKTTLN